MYFLFNRGNHHVESRDTVLDIVAVFLHMARALGHDGAMSDVDFISGPDSVNVLFEGFTEDNLPMLEEETKRGARFLFIATEEPTPKGFNHGLDNLMVERQRVFPMAAKYAVGILNLVPGTESWYGQHAPAAHMELGHAPGLCRFTNVEPTYEFGFYGGGMYEGSRRVKVLKKLARHTWKPNAVKAIANYSATLEERDAKMQQAKVIVQVRLSEQMGLVSNSRCNTALHLGRPVIAEPHTISHPWDEVIRFAPSLDAFYYEASAMCGMWRAAHAAQFEKFKRIMTPQFCLGEPLRKIGLAA